MTLPEFLKEHGYPVYPVDGEYYRFDRGATLNGWFHGERYPLDGHQVVVTVAIGDWKTGERFEWKSFDHDELSEEDRAIIDKQFEAEKEKRNAQKEAHHQFVAQEAEVQWGRATQLGESPYLRKKGISQELCGSRLYAGASGILTLIPARDDQGKLWGIQTIHPDGSKNFQKGMKVRGCYHLIGEIPHEPDTIYVTEGFATGASVHLATGKPTACGFNAGNLESVSSALRRNWPHHPIIVAGDDDRRTKRPDGTPYNPGREKAQAAARAVGGSCRFPHFDNPDGHDTDWNDLAALAGLAEVKRQLENPPDQQTSGSGPESIDPLFSRGKKGLPAQQAIVDHLLSFFGPRLLRQDRDIFIYTGTHWRCFTPGEYDKLKVLIQQAYGGRAEYKHVSAVYNLLLCHLPNPPANVDLFAPNPFAANFLNGTLWLQKGRDFKYSLDFRPHRAADYVVNCLPYEYRAGDTTTNAEFETMLGRVFQGDPDLDQKKRAVAQMYGACLMPAFPRLFMLHGKPGTGKSTVINIACRLVHKDNLSSVPPNQWHGFNMESMTGKLVNADTDIPLNEPMTDEIIKKVIERKPFRIRRKGVKDLTAPIPSVHLFGGNSIPKTLDGVSGAHTRRWTFIEFKAFTPQGKYLQEYWDYCFDQSPQGVLNFAVAGLLDLLANDGHFVNPASGVAAMEEWQLQTDPVGQFLLAITQGEKIDSNSQVIAHPDAKIERALLWQNFKTWFSEEYSFAPKMGRTTFFKQMRHKKYVEKTIHGVRYFSGLGVGVPSSAQY